MRSPVEGGRRTWNFAHSAAQIACPAACRSTIGCSLRMPRWSCSERLRDRHHHRHRPPSAGHALVPLIVLFASIGIGLSLLVNVLVLRAAFRPLAMLNRVAQAVRKAIVTPAPMSSPRAIPKWRSSLGP